MQQLAILGAPKKGEKNVHNEDIKLISQEGLTTPFSQLLNYPKDGLIHDSIINTELY